MDDNFRLQDYLEKYLVFEVDFLTDDVNDKVDVSLDDCYMLCYSYCDVNGRLNFMVLSIGNSVDCCTKGLELPGVLKYYSYDEIMKFPFEEIVPSQAMVNKCDKLMSLKEPLMQGDRLRTLRTIELLDDFRDRNYPDVVEVCILLDSTMVRAKVKLETYKDNGMIVGIVADCEEKKYKSEKVYVVVVNVGPEQLALAIPTTYFDMFKDKVVERSKKDIESVFDDLEEILDDISKEDFRS